MSCADDDLDALLDDALATVDEQESTRQQAAAALDAQLKEEEAMKHQQSHDIAGGVGGLFGDGGGDPNDPMFQATQKLLSALSQLGKSDASDDDLAQVRNALSEAVANLRSGTSGSAEDEAKLKQCEDMLRQVDGCADGDGVTGAAAAGGGGGEGVPSAEQLASIQQRLEELYRQTAKDVPTTGMPPFPGDAPSLEQLMALAAAAAKGPVSDGMSAAAADIMPPPMSASSSSSPPGASSMSDPQLVGLMQMLLRRDVFLQPFRDMASVFPIYLASDDAVRLPSDTRMRYEQQHRQMCVVVEFVETNDIDSIIAHESSRLETSTESARPLHDADDDKSAGPPRYTQDEAQAIFGQFINHLETLQGLGEPPAALQALIAERQRLRDPTATTPAIA